MRSEPNISVQVRRVDLIKAIEAAKKKADAEYERKLEAYEKAMNEHHEKVARRLEKIAGDLRKGRGPKLTRYTTFRDLGVPTAPDEPVKPTGYDNPLKLLKLSSQEKMTVSQSTYGRYFD